MLKFDRIIQAEKLDVTIDTRRNIEMTRSNYSGQSKNVIEIKNGPEDDWTCDFITDGICGL